MKHFYRSVKLEDRGLEIEGRKGSALGRGGGKVEAGEPGGMGRKEGTNEREKGKSSGN